MDFRHLVLLVYDHAIQDRPGCYSPLLNDKSAERGSEEFLPDREGGNGPSGPPLQQSHLRFKTN
jgi:hypothetical protein